LSRPGAWSVARDRKFFLAFLFFYLVSAEGLFLFAFVALQPAANAKEGVPSILPLLLLGVGRALSEGGDIFFFGRSLALPSFCCFSFLSTSILLLRKEKWTLSR